MFAGRTWSIDLPEGYREVVPRVRPETLVGAAFASTPRADGTRAMLLVTLLDVRDRQSPDLLQRFGKEMIEGVARRRENWTVQTTETKIGDAPAIRYEWSGEAQLPNAGGIAEMKGVMICGIDGGIAFSLHTQDFVEHAQSLEAGEKALRTFRIAP